MRGQIASMMGRRKIDLPRDNLDLNYLFGQREWKGWLKLNIVVSYSIWERLSKKLFGIVRINAHKYMIYVIYRIK